MVSLESIPWPRIAENLREQADKERGIGGALIGVGFGIAITMAARKDPSAPINIPALLAGAAFGVAYGATDAKQLRGDGHDPV